jgi:hypothetical protein
LWGVGPSGGPNLWTSLILWIMFQQEATKVLNGSWLESYQSLSYGLKLVLTYLWRVLLVFVQSTCLIYTF